MKRSIEVDHIFLFVSSESRARQMMSSAGLRVNYARAHPGQGTRNLCACLDDIFIELLWLDGTEIMPSSEKILLGLRGRGKGNPIGISWRGDANFDCVSYSAPFLPKGTDIRVARMSLDLSLPFVFKSPGGKKPIDRYDDLVGKRQYPDLSRLYACEIRSPDAQRLESVIAPFANISVTLGPESIRFMLCDKNDKIARDFVWFSDL